ncbi:hypothetical protein AB0C96_31925 [Streptomyces sp. NPDC048506]|uniref:Orn/Lys/Arg family decarboxylase n=1 Tax=Streptomyces sp. NPDC048506 TaxID=3155028 RepID=UPI003412F7C4
MTAQEAAEALADGRDVVSATFVTPYPPGLPVLVPGQVISREVLAYMQAVDTRELHGYRPDTGYRVFTEAALAEQLTDRQPGSGGDGLRASS